MMAFQPSNQMIFLKHIYKKGVSITNSYRKN